MKQLFTLFFIFFSALISFAQEINYPLFDNCTDIEESSLNKQCFENTLIKTLKDLANAHSNFNLVDKSNISIIFEVDHKGKFNLIFVETHWS